MDDVIVVGAGPAGNNTALGLATLGFKVTVIDWRHTIGDKLCTGIIGQECAGRFPVGSALVHRSASSAHVFTPKGEDIHFQSPSPKAYIINRVEYVASFAHKAARAGASYILGQRVMDVSPDKDGVTVSTESGRHQARALVLATGFGSPLTRQLGLGSVPDYVTGVQAEVRTRDVENVEIYLGSDVSPGFFCWLAPTQPGWARVGLLARDRAKEQLVQFIQRLEERGKVARMERDISCWGIPLRPLRRTWLDRVLVVGDAAGQVKPTTGGGIYYSLLSSEMVVDVLGNALASGDLSAQNLSRYEKKWKSLLSPELDMGYSARRLYESLNDQQISLLVKHASRNGVHSALVSAEDTSFDWHSRIISRVMRHNALSGVLKLVNPWLARLARRPDYADGPGAPVDQPNEVLADATGTLPEKRL